MALMAACTSFLWASIAQVGGAESPLAERAVVSMGDTARLQRVLARARRGEPMTLAVIGGSITQGASASRPELRWGNLLWAWLQEQLPQAEIGFHNAGIGATGSNIGAHRAAEQLLAHKPDLVAVEFAVNDANDQSSAETLEGLVRQILGAVNQPAVLLLFTMNNAGGNAQEWHAKVGEHYGLPMISYRDALWPEIEAGRIAWEDVSADVVHPNDRGHGYCAEFIAYVLAKVLAGLPADEALPGVPDMPPPLYGTAFEFATYFNAATLEPTANEGFGMGEATFLGPRWAADDAGSTIEFEVAGTAVGLVYYRVKGDMGIAEASVDDGEPVRLQGWFEADWGGYSAYVQLAKGLPPGKHIVRVRVLPEAAEESNGHHFEIHAVMVAGTEPAHAAPE